MNKFSLFGLLGLLALAGCGGSGGPATTAPAEQPLTVAEWQSMPADKKYQAETFERLKVGEPKFQAEKAWDEFYRKTVQPGRKKELAAAK
jgi:ABC-type glycerol-3-phosphate transport system substrate-binding protein